jgi:hypothetical protein
MILFRCLPKDSCLLKGFLVLQFILVSSLCLAQTNYYYYGGGEQR